MTSREEFDYTALTSAVTRQDLREYRQRHKVSKWWITIIVMVAVLFGLPTAIAIGIGVSWESRSITEYGPFGFFALFALAVGGAMAYGLFTRDRDRVRLERFANANKLTVQFDQKNPPLTGMIFDEGHTRELEAVVVKPDTWQIGNFTYVTGGGRSRRSHSYGFIQVTLPRRLPHMVLDAKRNNFLGMSNLTDSFDKSQQLALEGDFNDHFTLYAPKQYERDALYVFTPDVMVALIDAGGKFDMEVVDDKLYIYNIQRFNLGSGEAYKTMLHIVGRIGTELRTQSDYYADERVGDRSANMVAQQGARLKSGVSIVSIAVLFVIGGYMLYSFLPLPDEARSVVILLVGIVFWVVIGGLIVKRFRK